jgi:hypothetical protein
MRGMHIENIETLHIPSLKECRLFPVFDMMGKHNPFTVGSFPAIGDLGYVAFSFILQHYVCIDKGIMRHVM